MATHNSGLPSGRWRAVRDAWLGEIRSNVWPDIVDSKLRVTGATASAIWISPSGRCGSGAARAQSRSSARSRARRSWRGLRTGKELSSLAGVRRQEAGGETRVGRLSAVIDPPTSRALTGLGHELLHRLEKVHMQTGEAVDALQLPIGGPGGEAIIADELADDGAVLLLDMSAVVLAGPAAREGNAMARAIGQQLVDEFPARVIIRPEQRIGSRVRARWTAMPMRARPLPRRPRARSSR